MSKRFIYGVLFNFPRAFLEIIQSVITILTLGYSSDKLTLWKINDHNDWAIKITNKYGKP